MREVKLAITVNKPAAEVFAFAINPANTPKWLDFISVEETSDWPIEIGAIYRNKGTTDGWNEYVVSNLESPFTQAALDKFKQVIES